MAETLPTDEHLSPDGRVMEVLSEHLCQGWLEGYLLTGRHGLFNCYEAFTHIVDSMFNQHAKRLKISNEIRWRRPVASLNYLLTSHVWRQDHNGFTHQDPGFLDIVLNKKAEVVRVYLPPDANTLLSVANHVLGTRQYVNVIVAGKQKALNYLRWTTPYCTRRAGSASGTGRATTKGTRTWSWPAPATFRRSRNHPNLHVRGYKEEGTVTTLFDMVLRNDLDRFHLVMDVIDRVPRLRSQAATRRQQMMDERVRAAAHAREHVRDADEISGWTWRAGTIQPAGSAGPSASP